MAQAAIDSGQQDRAEHYYKEAIRVAPKASKPHALLANLYRSQNRLAEAQASYEAAIELATGRQNIWSATVWPSWNSAPTVPNPFRMALSSCGRCP